MTKRAALAIASIDDLSCDHQGARVPALCGQTLRKRWFGTCSRRNRQVNLSSESDVIASRAIKIYEEGQLLRPE